MEKLNIIWKFAVVKVDSLKEWTKNPRKITEDKYKKLVKDIKKYGFHQTLTIDLDGTIISGHQRKRALKEIGIKEIGVMVPERQLTEEEREVISIASNKSSGIFDFDGLANNFNFESLLEGGFEPFELGFATSKEQEGEDVNTLEESMETYLAGNVKQLSFHFSSEDYEDVVTRLDKVMTDLNLKSHTEVFLKLLEEYEKV